MIGPCMCGDIQCNSCGPAQGNYRCSRCGMWTYDEEFGFADYEDEICNFDPVNEQTGCHCTQEELDLYYAEDENIDTWLQLLNSSKFYEDDVLEYLEYPREE